MQAVIACLMGPTGAGKTALAERLTECAPFEIISVDSGMVYRGLDIGTAKPSPLTLRRVPHRLIDIVDPDVHYSAAAFRRDATRAIEEVRTAGRIPLLVGGTGLYFRALLSGLSALPSADAGLRARLEGERRELGLAALHARLARVDPQAAGRIHANDSQRIQRALEVYELTGTPMSELLRRGERPLHDARKLVLAPRDRGVLRARIAARFAGMVARGLINEARAVIERYGGDANLPGLKLVGYREVCAYIRGGMDRAGLTLAAVAATRALAKRQLTWLRREPDADWLDSEDPQLLEKAKGALTGNYM
jgi:tRNA dimethylallyltransferase